MSEVGAPCTPSCETRCIDCWAKPEVDTDTRVRLTYAYRGLNRRGVAETGTLESARGPAAFTERRFQQGWRSLTVTMGEVEVARIERLGGPRRWWAEAP